MKQKERVLQYMRDFGSITALDALKDLGVMRLSARIYDLRDDGYSISSETETARNRYGEPISYSRYSLKSDDDQESLW